MTTEVRRTLCRMCDDRCGIEVHVEDGRVVDITGDREHVYNRGRICIKARAAVEMVNHPDRLTTPLKRCGRGWVEVGLEEALDDIAGRLAEARRRHGPQSLAVWKGEAIGFAQQEGLARRFAHAVGTPNYLSNDSLCYVARYLGYDLTMGGWPVPDFENARCIVVWGANPPASLPNVSHAIGVARRRGAALVVVDPRRSTSARRASVHAQVRPGTDGALVWALVRELIESGAYDAEAIAARTLGFDEAAAYARSFTPERAAAETGVPAATVREIAALLADAAPRVVVYPGNGLEHHESGVDVVRTLAMLDVLLGTIGRAGGTRLAAPSPLRDLTLYDEVPLEHLHPLGADRFPMLYAGRRECHTMTAMGAMLEADPYPLRALVLTAGNPALTNPSSARVRDALSSLDLLVVRDLFMSETAELAHYVLPGASFLERSELHLHVEPRTLTLTDAVVSLPGVQTEYELWRDLAGRLGAGAYFPWADERALNAWLLAPSGLTIEELESDRRGVRFGAAHHAASGETTFGTPSGRFELVSPRLAELGYRALPEYVPPAYSRRPDPERPFVAIAGARKLPYAASRYRNLPSLRRAGGGPEVELHPDDATALAVRSGDVVRLTSRTGAVEAPARVVAAGDILPGVVQMSHGWREANVNQITPDDSFDPISGFPTVREVEVSVEKVRAAAPAGTVR